MRPLRIGVNALYLIPGGVGGTEIYLHELLRALAEIDARNEYFVFTNRETGPDLVPQQPNFHGMPQRVRARFRPARIVWEQTVLPLAAARLGLDALLNPGFTAPVYCGCAAVTVFHDMQHKRHPEHFRRLDLLSWRMLLFASAHRATLLLADSDATRADVLRYYRLPGLNSAEAALRSVPARLSIRVSLHVRGIRHARVGSSGRGYSHRLLENRAAFSHRGRGGAAVRAGQCGGDLQRDGATGRG